MTHPPAPSVEPAHVVVVGGGFSAVAFVAQLLRATARPVRVTIVEPRAALGQGRAYSTDDPDHRINAPTLNHMALAGGLDHFHQWFLSDGGLERDPEARAGEAIFPRRAEFGRYLTGLLANDEGRSVQHLRDRATGIAADGSRWQVLTEGGHRVPADRIVVATGHAETGIPSFVDPGLRADPRFMASPWAAERIAGIAADARLLILGSGLTAADVIASLVRQGHRGPVRVVSRRGLRPQPLPPAGMTPAASIYERLERPVPEFLVGPDPLTSPTVRRLLRRLRARIAAGQDPANWYEAFDDLRDALWKLWPRLSADDQRRFLRHLKPWYDSYRYRLPPQTRRVIGIAQAQGWLTFEAAQLVSIDAGAGDPGSLRVRRIPRGQPAMIEDQVDRVINCTGPQSAARGSNPFVDALLDAGMARAHASRVGLDVDAQLSIVDAGGAIDPRIRVIGPPSAGVYADAIGAAFICAHVARIMPGFVAAL